MRLLTLASSVLLTACVTINIYFPAAAAEKAADQIIEDIQSLPQQPATPEPSARLHDWSIKIQAWLVAALDVVIPAAQAQQANLNIDSPEIRQLTGQMRQRFNVLLPFYRSGAIGIREDGLLTVRAPQAVPLPQRAQVNQQVNAENNDRQRLYQAIARANGHPEWVGKIQQTFAERWRSHAQAGWWYQQGGAWRQK
ncbi:MAG: DUF1318 domain-containing protein [Methylococcales bacterium]|nr:DUF1318 domain-containing protein [Methylococcales bacterium]